MYIIEKHANYNIDDNSDISSLSDNTIHAEVLTWFNCSTEEWNLWYEKYMEGEFEGVDVLPWCVLRQVAANVHYLNELNEDVLQSFYAVVTPKNVESIFEELVQYEEDRKELLCVAQDRIMLAMLIDLEYAINKFFPSTPYEVQENILWIK